MKMTNGRSRFSQFWASILANAIYAMANYPVMMINILLTPFSLLIVIIFVSHGTLLPIAIEGALIMTMISGGLSLQSDLSHLKNDFKVQDMVVSSPTSPMIYLVGMALSELVYALPAIIILAILCIFYVHLSLFGYITLILVLAIMFTFASALGFFISTFTSDVMQSWAYLGIITIVISALPPVYYPITYIPQPFQYLAYLSPATYAAELVQNASGFVSLSTTNIIVDWAVIIAVTAFIGVLAAKKSQWREH